MINVDPGEEATGVGFYCTPAGIDRLNRAFRTDVRLVNTTLDQAGLADGSIDTIYSISTIEHIPESELPGVAAEMRRILRPGGHIVLTIDLFLDLAPFTGGTRNRYGWNIDVKRLVDHLGCELVIGDEAELYGYPAFRAEHVLEQLPELLYGVGYPACAQLLMLAKSRERIARDPDDHFGVARGTLEGSRPDVPLVGALSERGRPVGPHGDRRAEASLSAPAGKEARPHCPSAQGCPHSSPRRQWGRSSVGPVALRQRVYR